MLNQEQLVEATFEQLFPGGVSEVRRIPNHRVRPSMGPALDWGQCLQASWPPCEHTA